jgi:hypothetical protein
LLNSSIAARCADASARALSTVGSESFGYFWSRKARTSLKDNNVPDLRSREEIEREREEQKRTRRQVIFVAPPPREVPP